MPKMLHENCSVPASTNNSIQFFFLLSIKTPITEQYNRMKNIYIKKRRHYDFNDYKINL